ncbi:MAG: transglutaminase domain-containing protein [Phycisphaerae bacterium]|nr:transglutaminase domain-containing protein [Phycisphaerae bacterium]
MMRGKGAAAVVLLAGGLASISCTTNWGNSTQGPEGPDYSQTYEGPFTRTVKATLQFTIEPSGDAPAGDPWHLWQAVPRDTMTQEVLSEAQFDVEPTNWLTDPDFGNTIAHWEFSEARTLTVRGEFTLKVNNVLTQIDPDQVEQYDTESAEYVLYTRSERINKVSDPVRAIAEEIRDGCEQAENPYLLAQCAYWWVLDHMVYAYPLDRDATLDDVLADSLEHAGVTYYRGDCGSYSCLYNSILRALGIPARMAVGGWSVGEDQWHVWSEILIPGYGWIPVDTSAADVFLYDEGAEFNALGDKYFGGAPFAPNAEFYFGNIDPFRFVFSIGNDIALEPVVDWDMSPYAATAYYFEGRAGYMQTPIYHFGLSLDGYIAFEEIEP